MAAGRQIELIRIGATLKNARTRQGLDIRTVEEQTKIRIKYLRALESEDWEVLPNAAYTKGFLRTYATLLALDPDALVDDFRRQVESALPNGSTTTFGEPVLEGREPWRQGPRVPVLAVVGLLALATIVILALIGGSGDDSTNPKRGAGAAPAATRRAGQHGGRHHQARARAATVPVSLRLHVKDGLEACLVAGDGRVLIDSQTLSSGAKAGPFQAKSFRLDLDSGGAVKVTIAGRDRVLRSRDPASYALRAGHARPLSFRGPECP
jgi:hypothetical protein